MILVLIHKLVVALGSSYFVIVDTMVFVGVGELLAVDGFVVGAVVEAVALPCGIGELGPFDVVGQQLLGFGVHHIDFGPVRAAARNGVGGVLAVVGSAYAGQGHCTVVAELVGVEEHLGFLVKRACAVEHRLILQSVVLVEVVPSVLL